ncbi:DDE-type integrase/transposase/recombinase [Streptomyces sp. NPDC048483]|uniref:DDE-type integrase/transposase/recombinase n=1 Tax=Streptomyces sp. NPDC048483 TaxID=3154927 RepID=UPI00341DB481
MNGGITRPAPSPLPSTCSRGSPLEVLPSAWTPGHLDTGTCEPRESSARWEVTAQSGTRRSPGGTQSRWSTPAGRRCRDLATREIVGYPMADHHRATLVVDALRMTAGRGRLKPGCIAHSDRGSQDTSDELRREIGTLNMRQSMGRTGSCDDNAAAESFFAVLKEESGTRIWPDRATARAEIFSFIETFYNRRRLRKHPERGYLTPP